MEKQDIYHKLYMLTKLLYKTVHNMPREYKYGIGQEAIALCWACLDGYFEINSLKNENKLVGIKKLSVDFDKLKTRLRMTQELGVINKEHFAHLCENYLFSIGDQIGGWLEWGIKKTVCELDVIMK